MEQKLWHISFWTFLSLRNRPLKIKALYDEIEKCSLVRFPWNLGQVILYVWELVKLVCVDKSGTGQVGSGKTEETCRWLMIPPLQNTALRHITVLRQLLMLSLRCLFVTLLTLLDYVILDFQHLNPVTRVWRVGLFDFGSGSGRVWPKSSGFGFGFWYFAYYGHTA